MGGSGNEVLMKCPPSSLAVLWFVNVRETKPRKKKNLRFLVLIRRMKEGGESKIFLCYPRDSGISHQFIFVRGVIG